MEKLLAPVPTPAGMDSREIVRRAIELECPPRLPYSFVVPLETDFFETVALQHLREPVGSGRTKGEIGDLYYDEWGVGQEITKHSWDHVVDHPLCDLHVLADYRFPDVTDVERFGWMRPYLQQAREAGKYVVAADPVMMYERMRTLMGFEELMLAPYTQPRGLDALLDRLTDLTVGAIERWAAAGPVDGFMTWEDFGLQTALPMKVETFRAFYKPRYARIVEAAHRNGMHYIWHNCGQIVEMLPDMIDIGVDVVQLDQPRLMGHRRLAAEFGGRICFWNTVDIQWSTGPAVSGSDIHTEVRDMTQAFSSLGGLMARQYPQPEDIQLSRDLQTEIYRAFLDNGCGL